MIVVWLMSPNQPYCRFSWLLFIKTVVWLMPRPNQPHCRCILPFMLAPPNHYSSLTYVPIPTLLQVYIATQVSYASLFLLIMIVVWTMPQRVPLQVYNVIQVSYGKWLLLIMIVVWLISPNESHCRFILLFRLALSNHDSSLNYVPQPATL